MENVKTNDWVAVNLNMPEASHNDLIHNGITTENTTLKEKNFYKDTNAVKEMFTNPKDGKFNNEAFDKYYDYMAYNYNKFADKDFTEKAVNDIEYHPYNDLRSEDEKVETNVYKVTAAPNPFRLTMGMKGINKFSDPKYSARELAQMNNVYNSETGEKQDWKPNDDLHTGLWDFWKNPTLVLAQYDSDGNHYDQWSGRNVQHKKGDLKTDEKGFYYETLGKREAYNRQVLSWADTMTEEGTWINDYDYMESDGLDKSIAGVVAKTATKLAPMFIPGFGLYYGLALAGVELMNIMPMIAKAGIGLFVNDEHTDKGYWKTLNQIQGFSKTLSTSGVSDYAASDIVNPENFGQLVVDIVGQLKTQQGIASIPSMIGMNRKGITGYAKVKALYGDTLADKMRSGSLNALEKAQILEKVPEAASYINRIVKNIEVARAMSTTYMAATSAAGVTEEAKALGLDERDTAALYLGVSLGFFGMMRALPIGEWATKGIGLDDAGNIMKDVIKKEGKNFAEQGARLTESVSKKAATELVEGGVEKGAGKVMGSVSKWNTSLISKGKEWGEAIAKQLKDPIGYSGAALAESTEEMSEEAMQDGIKGIYNGLSAHGLTSSDDKKFHYGDIKSIIARYGMAGFGGGMGGVIFRHIQGLPSASASDARKEEMIIRNHGLEGMLKEIDKWESKGVLPKTLSFETKDVELPNGSKKTVFLPATTYEKSQNAVISNMLRDKYKRIQDQIFQEGIKTNIELYEIYDQRADALIKTSANSSLSDDYDDITASILALRSQIEQALDTVTSGDTKDPAEAVASGAANVAELQLKLRQERERLAAIHDGSKFPDYQMQALFNINSGYTLNSDPDAGDIREKVSISEPFVGMTIDALSMKVNGKLYRQLSPTEKEAMKVQHKTYMELNGKEKFREGYKRFVQVNEKASLDAQALVEYTTSLKEKLTYMPEESASTLMEAPNKNNILEDNINRATLSNNIYKNDLINVALDMNNEAYTKDNRILALGAISDVVTSTEKLPSDVISDFKKVVNSFSFGELVDPITLFATDKDNLGIDVETGDFDIDYLELSAISDMFTTKDASRALLEEIQTAKVVDLEKIQNKYLSMIEASTSEPEVKAKSKENLIKIMKKIQVLPIYQVSPEETVTLDALVTKQVELNKALDRKSVNTLQELLAKFEMQVRGQKTSIIELLSTEFDTIAKLNEIMEYEINDPDVMDNLLYATQLLKELESVIMAATEYTWPSGESFGFNSTANKLYPDVELGVINQESSFYLINELQVVGSRVNYLLELSKINSEDKIKNQKESGIVMEALFFEQFTKDKALRTYIDSVKIHGEPFMNDELAEVIESANLIKAVLAAHREKRSEIPTSLEALTNYEKQVVGIQSALHKRFNYFLNKIEGTDKEKLSSLMGQLYGLTNDGKMSPTAKSVFPAIDLTHGTSTNFSSTEETIQPLDLFIWFNTTLAVNPVDFIGQLRGTETDGSYSGIRSSTYAPFYGQEYAAKVVFGILTQSDWMRGAISLLSDKDGFLPNIIKSFTHGVLVDGRPGSGKSTGVVQHLARMLEEAGVPYWAAAPFKEQADNLNIVFKNKAGKSLDKKDLLYELLNRNEALITAIENKDNLIKREEKYNVTPHSFFNLNDETMALIAEKSPKSVEGLPPVIFIDEITHFSMAELTAINIALSNMDNPPVLVMLGDTKQNGYLHEQEKSNINLFNMWKTPKLSASIRNSNNHKKKNLDNVAAIGKFVEEEYLKADLTALDDSVYEKIASTVKSYTEDDFNKLKLFNHTTPKGKVYGEKVVPKNELSIGLIRTAVRNLAPGGKLGFITNNLESDIVKQIKEDSELKALVAVVEDTVVLRKEDNVQGLEFEDTIIDVDWKKYRESASHGIMNTISNLYTLMSRSESGSIIVDNDLTNYNVLPILTQDSDSYYDTKLDPTLVASFKETRANILDSTYEAFKGEESKESPFVNLGGIKSALMPTAEVLPEVSKEALSFLGLMEQEERTKMTVADNKNGQVVSSANMNNSKLICYPFYLRFAEEIGNEDAGYLKSINPDITEEEIKQQLTSIKTAILYDRGPDALSDLLGGDEDLLLDEAKLIVRGTRYKSELDRTHTNYKKDLEAADDSPFLRVVLKIPRVDAEPVTFTIAVFASSNTVGVSKKYELQTKLIALQNKVTSAVPSGDFDSYIDFVIKDENYKHDLTPSTNLQIEKIGNGETISYQEFVDRNPDALISTPYIVTGAAPDASFGNLELTEKYKKWIRGEEGSTRAKVDEYGNLIPNSLVGKAVCYVSFDPTITNPEELRTIYENERLEALRLGNKAPIPKVKMIMLNSKAYSPMEWFRKTHEILMKHKSLKTKIAFPLGTMAAPSMSGRILNTLIKIHQETAKANPVTTIDGKVHLYLSTVFDQLKKISGFESGTNLDKVLEFFTSKKFVNLNLGTKAETVSYVYSKDTKEPIAWSKELSDAGKLEYIHFDNNHLYKLMSALNIAMFGGIISNKGGELAFQNALDASGMKGDEDLLQAIENRFDKLFTADPNFKKGIFTHAVYKEGRKKEKSHKDKMQAAEAAFDDMNFTTDVNISLPNILLDLNDVIAETEAREDEVKRIKEAIADSVKVMTTAYDAISAYNGLDALNRGGDSTEVAGLIGNIEADHKANLAMMIELTSKMNPEDFGSYSDFAHDQEITLNEVGEIMTDFQDTVKQIEDIIAGNEPPPSKTIITDAQIQQIAVERLDEIFEVANEDLEFKSGEISKTWKKGTTHYFEALGVYGDSTAKVEFKIDDKGKITITKNEVILNPVEETEVEKLMKTHGAAIQKMLFNPKSPLTNAIQSGVLGNAVNLKTFVGYLTEGNLPAFKAFIEKEPNYLSIFIALNEEEIVNDLLKLINDKDITCLTVPF